MRICRHLLMLSAFLIMVSSVLTLYSSDRKMVLYVNVAAMVAIAIAVSIMNFKNHPKDNI